MKWYSKQLYNLYLKDLRNIKDKQLQYFLRTSSLIWQSLTLVKRARAGVN